MAACRPRNTTGAEGPYGQCDAPFSLEYLLDRFEGIQAGEVPPDTGVVLRSPVSLDVILRPAA